MKLNFEQVNKITPPYSFMAGILLGSIAMVSLQYFGEPTASHTHDHDEVHVHADWKLIVNDEHIRFTDAKYQSDALVMRHPSIHLHDFEDQVIHRHADNVTFGDFITSLGFTFTDTCLTTDTNTTYCTDEENNLLLFVNGEIVKDKTSYPMNEADQILLYYGPPDSPRLPEYLVSIADEACLYSGTCLERGYKTTSSCGLTCEVEF